jgi:hypothetical protein
MSVRNLILGGSKGYSCDDMIAEHQTLPHRTPSTTWDDSLRETSIELSKILLRIAYQPV